MNPNEARLMLIEELADILVDLTIEDDTPSEAEEAELREAMMDAADIIAEGLQLEVVSVDDLKFTITVDLAPISPEA
jgi:hypothetical protein